MFRDAINELKRNNRFAQAVYVHEVEDYMNDDLYLVPNGKAGFALENDNSESDDKTNLISVFAYKGQRAGHSLVESAVSEGATHLDCYDIGNGLPDLYGKHGFRPIARVKFDPKEADPDWDYEHLHEPDVMTMAITDNPPQVTYMEYPAALAAASKAGEDYKKLHQSMK
ncbi:hypothetical protein DF196_06460 [Bifidobacterium callitrichidarum]|uniref:N-acetyltransferase n=1 Tax=Bifidobacterium callitrichidarum TaxID=2052941 RepID=A0A2U2N8Y6_9BIFI|nr:hypothetical protein DF196_06460 [Bifidobacterium callitrichidarum]